jgi:hypothetical protein
LFERTSIAWRSSFVAYCEGPENRVPEGTDLACAPSFSRSAQLCCAASIEVAGRAVLARSVGARDGVER